MKSDARLAGNTKAPARSSTVPHRPAGVRLVTRRSKAGALFRLGAESSGRSGAIDVVSQIIVAIDDDRAVFGTLDDVETQLNRYEDIVDLALLYSPHYGLSDADVHENETAILRLTS